MSLTASLLFLTVAAGPLPYPPTPALASRQTNNNNQPDPIYTYPASNNPDPDTELKPRGKIMNWIDSVFSAAEESNYVNVDDGTLPKRDKVMDWINSLAPNPDPNPYGIVKARGAVRPAGAESERFDADDGIILPKRGKIMNWIEGVFSAAEESDYVDVDSKRDKVIERINSLAPTPGHPNPYGIVKARAVGVKRDAHAEALDKVEHWVEETFDYDAVP